METRRELIQTAEYLAMKLTTKQAIEDWQIRLANSLMSFRLSSDQLTRIDEIINE